MAQGLGTIVGNVGNDLSNGFDSLVDSASSVLSSIANSTGTYIANIWGGGFVGVKDFGELNSAIETYIANVQAAIDEYNENADITSTVKGPAEDALVQYVQSTKTLLKAYGERLRRWKKELEVVTEKYSEGSSSIASNVSDAAAQVSAAAGKISLD